MSNPYDRILITGGGGMLAQAITKIVRARGHEPTVLDRASLDLRDPRRIGQAISTRSPTLVINCAAYTKVDLCESNQDEAIVVNGKALYHVAKWTALAGGTLVHFSTDFVFDGTSRIPYREDDATNPLSEYGRSKLMGEEFVPSNSGNWLIIRTAWLYGPGGNCFPQTMINLAKQGKPLKVVDDQIGSPTFTHDLAEATLNLIDADARGIYHVVNAGQTSWFDFTAAVLEEFGLKTELTRTTSEEWKKSRPNSAIRPAYSVLNTSKYTQTTGKTMRPWREALYAYRLALESTAQYPPRRL